MRCPYCLHPDTTVADSRESGGGASIKRRRRCTECLRRFTTMERFEGNAIYVLGRLDGYRSLFSRDKLASSIYLACKYGPLEGDEPYVSGVVDEVERALLVRGMSPISRGDLIRMVLDLLGTGTYQGARYAVIHDVGGVQIKFL